MAPKDKNQRISEDTMKASRERLKEIDTVEHAPMPTDLEFAVMRLRAAAYAARPGEDCDRSAAFVMARDAFMLADAAFSKDEKKLYGALVNTMPQTFDGVTQQVERIQVKYIKTTEYKVLFSPWTWLKLKLTRKPTVERYTDGKKVWPA